MNINSTPTLPGSYGDPQQPDPSQSQQLTPQQKMAMMLMGQQPQVNPRGAYSPLQGLGTLANSMVAARLWNQQQQPQPFQLGSSVPQAALNNANTSQDPLGALALQQGWTTPSN
ncbi:MAG: hypothetical protein JO006_03455 [Paucibacter sp.]|nr:hypothetical protein [Roseateles sp.]